MNAPITAKQNPLQSPKVISKIAALVPYFLGAALYLSLVFKFFAALPLIFVHLRYGRVMGIIASATNLLILWFTLGRIDSAWYFVFSVVLATAIAETLKLKIKLEWATLVSIGLLILSSVLLVISYARTQNIGPGVFVKQYIDVQVEEVVKNAEKFREQSTMSTQDLDRLLIDPEVTKRNILEVAPSVILISMLMIVVSNLMLVLKFNFGNIRVKNNISTDYFKLWKAPDHMIWPTLFTGFCLVLEIPGLTSIALNLFRFLMAIYCIQGLAILRYLFDTWKLKGTFRPLAYILAMTFLWPLVVSLGFFDLWFLFRERFSAK